MKTNRLCIAIILGLCLTTAAYSQEAVLASSDNTENVTPDPATEPAEGEEEEQEAPTFSFSGSIDTYFHSTLGTTNGVFGNNAPSTAFSDMKGFGLGMANLIATYAGDKVGFTADLVFGPRGRAAVFGS